MSDQRVPLILSETRIRRLRPFGAQTQPRAGVAVVSATNGHDVRVTAGRRTLGEKAFGPESTQYEIDIAEHQSHFDFQLKSAYEDFAFPVVAEVTWQVHDPAEVARRRIADGYEFVRRRLHDTLLRLSRDYDVERVHELEDAIRQHFEPPVHRLLDYCVRIVHHSIRISLDEAGTQWLQKIREARRAATLADETHHVELLRKKNAAELAEMEKTQQIRLEEMQRNFEREAERRTAEMQATLRAQDAESEAARRAAEEERVFRLERDRAEAFRKAMEQGDAAVLAVHLGRHPDDAKDIVRMIVENKSQAEERQAKLLADMIDKGIIIGADLEGVSRDVVKTVMGMMTRRTGGLFSLNTTIDMSTAALEEAKSAAVIDGSVDDAEDDAEEETDSEPQPGADPELDGGGEPHA